MTESCPLRKPMPKNPRLRPELEFSLVKEKGDQKVYTLFDPYNDRYFQFKEYECAISKLLDGNRSAVEVCQEFEEQFDAVLPPETLEMFVKKLFAMGLIEGAPIPPRKDKYSGLLFRKFKLFNPDKIFDVWIQYVGFLFTPLAVKIFWGILLVAGYLLLKRFHEVSSYGMPTFGQEEWVGLVIGAFIIIIIISTHEFAHGLSLKYYGGKVPEIGFMFMIFLPAVYCDVSDAWRLGRKKKLFVTFAGGFYEVVVGSFAVIIWTLAEPHLWLADVAYLVMIGSIFTIGFNFNPLIRLDGYYMLSDFLEMPNLRSESVEYLMRFLAFGKSQENAREYTLKEKIVYPLYGVLSTLFIMFMMFVIFSLLAGWLADTFRLNGILLSIFIVLYVTFSLSKGMFKKNINPQNTTP